MNIKTKSLGEFLKVYRKGEELSQVEFAKKLGISKQRLCDLEHNRSNVSISFCKKLALFLDVPPEWLVKLVLQHKINEEGLNLKVS